MNAPHDSLATRVWRWFDTWGPVTEEELALERDNVHQVDWLRVVPFLGLHLAVLSVIWVGWSPFAVVTAVALYAVRMFGITAIYHRYFSHRAFQTSRPMQFLLSMFGAAAAQRGPLWWAAHHRNHHRTSDTEADVHSPITQRFWWSHVGWVLSRTNFRTRVEHVRDLARYPELRFLDRFDMLVPFLLAVSLFMTGVALERWAPDLGTSGWQLLVWGFVISTVALYHATFSINSLAHLWGKRRYDTGDRSRNNGLLALLTFGEGWHNNHHRFPGAARQGFRWWELDLSYYALKGLAALGLVWDLRPVPAEMRRAQPRAQREEEGLP